MGPDTTNEQSSSIRLDALPSLDIRTERIKFLYTGAPTAIAVNIVISLLFVWILWDRVEQYALLSWFVALSFITLLRIVSLYFYKSIDTSAENINFWFYLFLGLTASSGVLWGMTIWVLGPINDAITPVLIVFTLGGLTAGAAAVLGAVLSVYFVYILLAILPSAIWFLQVGTESYTIMGMMLLIYIFAMMAAGYIYRKILIHSITISKELVDAKNYAEAANRLKTDFLASMSHEIRTPLNAIIGFSQILKTDQKEQLAKSQEESVNMILDAGRHLLDLVKQVMELAKIEANVAPLKFEELSYNVVLKECIPLIQIAASKANVTIDNSCIGDAEHTLWADKVRLKQVIINLLDNATKYNQQGGAVSLSCQKQDDGFLRIIISDTGQGIEKAKQQKLFQPFERLGYENSQVEGTGIGLLMSKRIIEQMRGRIGFSSVRGQGSEFWIEIPLAKANPPT